MHMVYSTYLHARRTSGPGVLGWLDGGREGRETGAGAVAGVGCGLCNVEIVERDVGFGPVGEGMRTRTRTRKSWVGGWG